MPNQKKEPPVGLSKGLCSHRPMLMPRSPTSISNHVEALGRIAVPLVGGSPWIGGGEGYTNSCETRARLDCRLIRLPLRLQKSKPQMRTGDGDGDCHDHATSRPCEGANSRACLTPSLRYLRQTQSGRRKRGRQRRRGRRCLGQRWKHGLPSLALGEASVLPPSRLLLPRLVCCLLRGVRLV